MPEEDLSTILRQAREEKGEEFKDRLMDFIANAHLTKFYSTLLKRWKEKGYSLSKPPPQQTEVAKLARSHKRWIKNHRIEPDIEKSCIEFLRANNYYEYLIEGLP